MLTLTVVLAYQVLLFWDFLWFFFNPTDRPTQHQETLNEKKERDGQTAPWDWVMVRHRIEIQIFRIKNVSFLSGLVREYPLPPLERAPLKNLPSLKVMIDQSNKRRYSSAKSRNFTEFVSSGRKRSNVRLSKRLSISLLCVPFSQLFYVCKWYFWCSTCDE